MNRASCPAAFLLALVLGGCGALVEEPEGSLLSAGFYRDSSDMESATLAAYQPMISSDLFKTWAWMAAELASDQVRCDANDQREENTAADFLDFTPGTRAVTAPWRPLYTMIYRANLVLGRAAGVPMRAAKRDSLMAEAKFLRGFAYLALTKMYGDVPLLLTEEDHANRLVGRTPTDAVHAQVSADLSAALAALPVTRRTSQWGRATRGAALMALADLYLWRASFLHSGEWPQTADYARQVIQEGVYALNDDYIRTFLPSNKGNPEMILVVTASGVDERSSSAFAQWYFPAALGQGQGGGWGDGHPTSWHLASYLPGDYRAAEGAGYRTYGCSPVPASGCRRFEAMPWKYRPTNEGVPPERGDVDIPLYRFAEALLIYAEAQNELGNTGAAVAYLNLIRARARKGTGAEIRASPADYAGPMDQGSVREAIFMERDWELAHEAKRWYDLVRRGPDYWLQNLRAHDPNAYAHGDPPRAYKMRWPVPQLEIDLNPKLTQNPGY